MPVRSRVKRKSGKRKKSKILKTKKLKKHKKVKPAKLKPKGKKDAIKPEKSTKHLVVKDNGKTSYRKRSGVLPQHNLETINSIKSLSTLIFNCFLRESQVSTLKMTKFQTGPNFKSDTLFSTNTFSIELAKVLRETLSDEKFDQSESINLKCHKLGRNREDYTKQSYNTGKEIETIIKYRNIQSTLLYIVDKIPVHPSRVEGILWSRLNDEKWRLYTFFKYPQNAAKSAILLATEGFVYLGSGTDLDDIVMCHFCYKVKNRWQPLDDIPEVHKQLSPDCSMVTQINCSNISVNTNLDCSLFEQLNPKQSRNRPVDTRHNEIETGEALENYKNPGENIEPDGTTLPRERYNNNYTQITSSSEQSTPTREIPADTASQSETSGASPGVATTTSSASSNLTSSNSTPSLHITSATASNTSTTVFTSQTSIAAGPSLPATSTPDPPEVVTQTVPANSHNSAKGNTGGPTYSELGIVTERPKRFEYAVLAKRMETFLSWPRDHHLRPKELAEAGFYYAGYGDCARCFYCGGGLRNWEDEDDVWVEHARWFPKCAYIRQQMGQVFVDTIQDMNKSFDHISMKMVMDKIGDAASAFQLDSKDSPLKRDPAVKTVVDMGYPLAEAITTAEAIKEDGNILSADKIYEKLVEYKVKKNPSKMIERAAGTMAGVSDTSLNANLEKVRALKEKNNQLRQQTVCKICMDKEVAVVFLPCGHFVSCTDCASAMKDCPVCRNHVKGIVRAFMG
ncbi:inhibitor of apoptosis protein-like [Biomphalaria glabrata]|uniref:Inhibitor of apoptosis protein-like n=1 Tax=Biomphalaria glabrata TaxID=6526 RepID=A0A9W3A687_BIOGL|nr:inhibitor of apoptosis protein-like [Biomphalaria glabrata]